MPDPIDPPPTVAAPKEPHASVASSADETAPLGAGKPKFGAPSAPGEVGVLGPYRVVKELGKGGMGAVYAAVDTRLNRRLAMKVMLPEFATNPDAKERFLREARAAAQINHDNVVTVYEADERDGVPYITMQFLEGYPLDEYLKKKGNPTIPQVLRIARETAAGLSAAHKLGLIHRDIKPANLWLEAPNGRVKVLDFGLAKPVDAEYELTKSGAVVGTPAYMSPEQGRGLKVDHRSDLFSLGSVLYRLCTGQLPFRGPTTMAVLMALGSDEPTPVRDLNPAVPEPLAALIHQLLAKNPNARPQTADDVVKRVRAIAQELEVPTALPVEPGAQPQVVYVPIQVTAVSEANPFADLDAADAEPVPAEPGEPAEPKPARPRSRGNGLWLAGGVVALAALFVGGVILGTRNKGGTETKVEPPDGTAASNKDKGKQPAPAADPDRRAAEYVLSVGGAVSVDGDTREIKAASDLPRGRFALTGASLAERKAATDAGLIAFKDCKNLTYLDLSHTEVTDAGLEHFKGCQNLTRLVLYQSKVTDAGLAAFKDCKNLTHLDAGAPQITGTGLVAFKDCKNLAFLGLYGSRVTDLGLANFRDCKNLTGLELTGNAQVTDAGLATFKDCKALTNLDLRGTQATDVGLAYFKDCKSLVSLWLSGAQVTDAGLANFRGCEALRQLTLIGTPVTDAGLAHFKGCKDLHTLHAGGTRAGDVGLSHFQACEKLATLTPGAQTTDAGLVDGHY